VDLASILIASSLTAESTASPHLRSFMQDAISFVASYGEVIEENVPHIYISALASLEFTSKISTQSRPYFSHLPVLKIDDVTQQQQDSNKLFSLNGYASSILSITISPDGTRLVSSSWDGTIWVWNIKTGKPVLGPIGNHSHSVAPVAISPDGNYLVSGTLDGEILVRDIKTGELALAPLQGHRSCVSAVAVSADGKHIVSGSWDCTIRVWDMQTGQPAMPPLDGHRGSVHCIAISVDGAYIVSGSVDRTIRVWDALTGEPAIEPIEGHTGDVWAVAISPDGTRVVSGSTDGTIGVWDLQTGEHVMTIDGHTSSVLSVAISPDGSRIISGSTDKTICMWDAATGEQAADPFEGHTDYIREFVTVATDGSSIISASEDKTIRLWEMTSGDSTPRATSARIDTTSVLNHANGTLDLHAISGSLDSQGWVRGPNRELILWVPEQSRAHFGTSSNAHALGQLHAIADLSESFHGPEWAKCYSQ